MGRRRKSSASAPWGWWVAALPLCVGCAEPSPEAPPVEARWADPPELTAADACDAALELVLAERPSALVGDLSRPTLDDGGLLWRLAEAKAPGGGRASFVVCRAPAAASGAPDVSQWVLLLDAAGALLWRQEVGYGVCCASAEWDRPRLRVTDLDRDGLIEIELSGAYKQFGDVETSLSADHARLYLLPDGDHYHHLFVQQWGEATSAALWILEDALVRYVNDYTDEERSTFDVSLQVEGGQWILHQTSTSAHRVERARRVLAVERLPRGKASKTGATFIEQTPEWRHPRPRDELCGCPMPDEAASAGRLNPP